MAKASSKTDGVTIRPREISLRRWGGRLAAAGVLLFSIGILLMAFSQKDQLSVLVSVVAVLGGSLLYGLGLQLNAWGRVYIRRCPRCSHEDREERFPRSHL